MPKHTSLKFSVLGIFLALCCAPTFASDPLIEISAGTNVQERAIPFITGHIEFKPLSGLDGWGGEALIHVSAREGEKPILRALIEARRPDAKKPSHFESIELEAERNEMLGLIEGNSLSYVVGSVHTFPVKNGTFEITLGGGIGIAGYRIQSEDGSTRTLSAVPFFAPIIPLPGYLSGRVLLNWKDGDFFLNGRSVLAGLVSFSNVPEIPQGGGVKLDSEWKAGVTLSGISPDLSLFVGYRLLAFAGSFREQFDPEYKNGQLINAPDAVESALIRHLFQLGMSVRLR